MNGNKSAIWVAPVSDRFFFVIKVVRNYLELLKLHLCLYISLSAMFGQVMASCHFSFQSIWVGVFVLILSGGSAVLNNIQDMEFDLYFRRTSSRSLPAKKVPLNHAVILSISMICAGLIGLFYFWGPGPFFIGMIAVFSYNGVYTPMKKESTLAIFPGAVSGMLPPLIGWSATGTPIFHPTIFSIMLIFVLWQIPHFFIIELKLKDDQITHGNDQKYPGFFDVFTAREIKLQILIWASLYGLAILYFIFKFSYKNIFLFNISAINAILVPVILAMVLFKLGKKNIPFCFATINLSMLIFMGTGICDTF